MKTFYIVYETADYTDNEAVWVTAPNQVTAIRSLPDGVEVIEVLEFDEDEAAEFALYDQEGDDDYRELEFDHDF